MDTDLAREVWDDLSARLGDGLRVVTRYRKTEFETVMRDDVRAAYTASEDREVVDATLVNQLSMDHVDDAFKVGDLEGVVQVFEEAWVLVRPDGPGGTAGFIVSIQRDHEDTSMADVEAAIEYLDAAV